MHEDARAANARSAFVADAQVMPFAISFSSRSFAHSSPPVTAMQPAFAMSRQSSGVKRASKRTFPHHATARPRRRISSETRRTRAGGIASSTKW